MAKIPASTFQSPHDVGVKIPQGVFQETARANVQLFEAFGEIPKELKRQLDEAQDIRNKSDVSDRLRGMRQLQADYLQQIQEERTDPSEWAPRWKSKLNEFEKSLTDKGIPPVVVNAVKERFKDFAGKSLITITGAALKENRKNARRGFESDYGELIRNEQFDAAEELVNTAHGDKVIDDIDQKEFSRGVGQKRRRADLDGRLAEDPAKYHDDLLNDRLGLPDSLNRREMQKAERALSKQKRETYERLELLKDAGSLETREDLEEELASVTGLTDLEKQAYLKNFETTQGIPPEEQTEYLDKASDIFDAFTTGQITFDEYATQWNDLSSRARAYGSRHGSQRLNRFIQARNPEKMLEDQRRTQAAVEDEAARKSEAELKEAAREQATKLKDLNSSVSRVVRTRLEGEFKINLAEKDFRPEQGLKKARFELEQRQRSQVLRDALEAELTEWASGLPEPPDKQQIIEQLDKVQGSVVTRISQGASQAKPSARERANQWLNRSSQPDIEDVSGLPDTTSGTMLPALPNFGIPGSPETTLAPNQIIPNQQYDLPPKRGKVQDGYAIGKASTYGFVGDKFEDAHKYGGMTSVGLRRGTEPWWTNENKPTIALAPETAKALGLTLPKKSRGQWDTSRSELEIVMPNGETHVAVYAENGMNNPKYPNSHNKLIDFSEQFQQLAGVKGGSSLDGVKIRPIR